MRIGALFVVLLGCGGADTTAAPAGPPPVPVKVATLVAKSLDRVLVATGTVEAVESTEIRPEIQGLVEEVLFQDGAVVKKGDPLVRLRAQDARASLLDAQARAQLATVDLERARTLFDRGDVARADLDRAVAADCSLRRPSIAPRRRPAARRSRAVQWRGRRARSCPASSSIPRAQSRGIDPVAACRRRGSPSRLGAPRCTSGRGHGRGASRRRFAELWRTWHPARGQRNGRRPCGDRRSPDAAVARPDGAARIVTRTSMTPSCRAKRSSVRMGPTCTPSRIREVVGSPADHHR
jgi:hypothetical protein